MRAVAGLERAHQTWNSLSRRLSPLKLGALFVISRAIRIAARA